MTENDLVRTLGESHNNSVAHISRTDRKATVASGCYRHKAAEDLLSFPSSLFQITPPGGWTGCPFIGLNSQLPQNLRTHKSINKGLPGDTLYSPATEASEGIPGSPALVN
jgi:hypothetical protein